MEELDEDSVSIGARGIEEQASIRYRTVHESLGGMEVSRGERRGEEGLLERRIGKMRGSVLVEKEYWGEEGYCIGRRRSIGERRGIGRGEVLQRSIGRGVVLAGEGVLVRRRNFGEKGRRSTGREGVLPEEY